MISFLSNSTGMCETCKQLITDKRGSEPTFYFFVFHDIIHSYLMNYIYFYFILPLYIF